jgi:hypothetical protein
MSHQTTFEAARARRTYTLTAHVTVHADADLSDPFTRFAVFRVLADRLSAAPLELDTPYGAATADIGLVTAVS